MSLTRELPQQRMSGSVLSEREIFLRMMNHLDELHTLARGMAQSRKQQDWLIVAGFYERNKQMVKQLMMKPMGLVLPGYRQ